MNPVTVLKAAAGKTIFEVPIVVEGRQASVGLDSGAADELAIAEDEARARGWLESADAIRRPDGTTTHRLPGPLRCRLGSIELVATDVWTFDRSQLSGAPPYLLGMKWLSRYQVELDYRTMIARLFPLESRPDFPREKSQLISYGLENWQPCVPVVLGHRRATMIWDTGNGYEGILFRDWVDDVRPGLSAQLTWSSSHGTAVGLVASSQKIEFSSLEVAGYDYAAAAARRSIRFPAAPFRALATPRSVWAADDIVAASLAGLLPGHLFGAERVLCDPRRLYLWRFGSLGQS